MEDKGNSGGKNPHSVSPYSTVGEPSATKQGKPSNPLTEGGCSDSWSVEGRGDELAAGQETSSFSPFFPQHIIELWQQQPEQQLLELKKFL